MWPRAYPTSATLWQRSHARAPDRFTPQALAALQACLAADPEPTASPGTSAMHPQRSVGGMAGTGAVDLYFRAVAATGRGDGESQER